MNTATRLLVVRGTQYLPRSTDPGDIHRYPETSPNSFPAVSLRPPRGVRESLARLTRSPYRGPKREVPTGGPAVGYREAEGVFLKKLILRLLRVRNKRLVKGHATKAMQTFILSKTKFQRKAWPPPWEPAARADAELAGSKQRRGAGNGQSGVTRKAPAVCRRAAAVAGRRAGLGSGAGRTGQGVRGLGNGRGARAAVGEEGQVSGLDNEADGGFPCRQAEKAGVRASCSEAAPA